MIINKKNLNYFDKKLLFSLIKTLFSCMMKSKSIYNGDKVDNVSYAINKSTTDKIEE
ncbi:MAG: hypothetical protein H8E55_50605 [Pelagibacterales bacterium]|nr:hypothetical protein [Pelagibacterales bacterium]